MSKAIALLAGLGAGYMAAQDKKRDQDREDARFAMQKTQFDNSQADRQTALDDRQALRDASAPVSVQDGTVYQPAVDDEGNAMPANPTAGTYTAGTGPSAARFASQGAAQEAVDQANAPGAVYTRQMAVLNAQDPMAAARLRSTTMQGDAAAIKIDDAKREQANAIFDDGVRKALQTGGPQALAQFMSDSAGDGKNGASKFQAVTAPDGKTWSIARVNGDGSTTPLGPSFQANDDGFAQAGFMLSRGVSDKDKLAHALALQKEGREADYQKGMLGVAQQNADTNAGYRRDMAAAAGTRAAAAAAGGSRKADHFTDKEWDAASKIEPSFVTYDNPDGGKAVESPELRLTYMSELNRAKSSGELSPTEAAEQARTTTLKLKNAAMDRVAAARSADPKSTLTEQQATRQILKDFQASQRAPAAAPAPAANTWPANAPPGGTVRPGAASMAAQGVAAPAGPPAAPTPLANVPTAQLAQIASSPRNSGWQEARAELQRRTAEAPDPRMADPAYDPASYR
jgi:hypothetical protein